ncbi:MAG: 1-aminocyclopropane-1-carboxylate deaminase [Coxiellaceae bacterium]|nr:1-aminocyclopropane-1-carboxylate deaminase [Coxiellaceae bacterium]
MNKKLLQFSKRGNLPSLGEMVSQYAAEVSKTRDDLIGMNLGAPGTGAPSKALDALREQMAHDVLGYTAIEGLPFLRQRISRMYQEEFGQVVSPENILVTYGASSAMMLACIAMTDEGDKLAVPLPCYNNYLVAFQSLGLDCEYIETTHENNFCITAEDIKLLDSSTRAIILVSPSNPTGSIIPEKEFKKIIAVCHERGITVISDEIYQHITYTGEGPSMTALAYSKDCIVINSFSKYYSIPGWRVGWMVIPDGLVEQMQSLARSYFVSPVSPAQYVAANTMDCVDELQEHVSVYAKNREILLERMPKIGFDRLPATEGAFYLYAHILNFHNDSFDFCKKMVREAGVIASPGKAFDPIAGDDYVRFSYAGTTDSIQMALDRLECWTKKL